MSYGSGGWSGGRQQSPHESSYPDSGEHDNMVNGRGYNDDHGQDDARLAQLRSQVHALRAITIEIGQEAREQNTFLDTMGLDLEKATGMMSRTMRNLRRLARTERGRSYMCYTVLFALVIFLIFFFKAMF